jgi:prepilin-type processing-associated H-X9-DG protein
VKLEPYIKNRQIFNCPDLKVGKNTFPYLKADGNTYQMDIIMGWKDGDADSASSQVMYGYNGYYLGGGQWSDTGSVVGQTSKSPAAPTVWYNNGIGVLESELSAPAATVLLVDNNSANADQRYGPYVVYIGKHLDYGGEVWATASGVIDTYDSIPKRHLGGVNTLFTDGHVKWLTKEALLWTPGLYASQIDVVGHNYASADERFLWNRF